jgi:hypothetical protein
MQQFAVGSYVRTQRVGTEVSVGMAKYVAWMRDAAATWSQKEEPMSVQEHKAAVEQESMELMQTLDDAWNAQDLETFAQRHKEDVVVRSPGQPPTHGIRDHARRRSTSSRPSPTSISTIGPTRSSSPRVTGPARLRTSRGR